MVLAFLLHPPIPDPLATMTMGSHSWLMPF
jgi:hypothetical protein